MRKINRMTRQSRALAAVAKPGRVILLYKQGDPIVTGDRAMLAHGEYQNIRILSLSTYLAR